jgi:5-methylcytosine-specific restriction endonuclease McrA
VLEDADLIDRLREQRTNLTALARIAPVLDDVDDSEGLLRSIDGFTPEEFDAVVAAMRPVARPIERVRPVVVAKVESACAVGTLWGSSVAELAAEPAPAIASRGSGSAVEHGTTSVGREILSGTSGAELRHPRGAMGTACGSSATERIATCNEPEPRVAVSFTLTREAHAALERVRTRLSHSRPKPLTLEQTINALVRAHETRSARPATTVHKNSKSSSRHIPKSTRDAVFERDGHRCTFVAPDGTRCTATHDLQIDHIVPFASGGSGDPRNLRVMCGARNRQLGEMESGTISG